jgi:hypothetical protein
MILGLLGQALNIREPGGAAALEMIRDVKAIRVVFQVQAARYGAAYVLLLTALEERRVRPGTSRPL